MSDFQDKLIKLLIAEAGGKPLANMAPEKTAEIIEVLANAIGTQIALQCEGDAKTMSELLEGASSYMFECAAKKKKAGQLIAELFRQRD